MDYDNVLSNTDQHIEGNGVRMVIDSKSLVYLVGTEIDYTDGFDGSQDLYLIIPMQPILVVVVVLLRSNSEEVGGLQKSFK